MDCFVAWLLAMTVPITTRVHALATQSARVVDKSIAPSEGVGNAGCPLHPQPRVHFVVVERTRVTTSTPESPGIPARNGFTAYVGLSPVTGLFCHRRLRKRGLSAPGRADLPSRELDASVGASGPHDFAVREKRLSSACRGIAHKSLRTRPAIPLRAKRCRVHRIPCLRP
jgi:hypothetical protein